MVVNGFIAQGPADPASGFDAYLLKPTAPDKLEQLLAAVPGALLRKSTG
jgi:hypothetical protein